MLPRTCTCMAYCNTNSVYFIQLSPKSKVERDALEDLLPRLQWKQSETASIIAFDTRVHLAIKSKPAAFATTMPKMTRKSSETKRFPSFQQRVKDFEYLMARNMPGHRPTLMPGKGLSKPNSLARSLNSKSPAALSTKVPQSKVEPVTDCNASLKTEKTAKFSKHFARRRNVF